MFASKLGRSASKLASSRGQLCRFIENVEDLRGTVGTIALSLTSEASYDRFWFDSIIACRRLAARTTDQHFALVLLHATSPGYMPRG